MRKSEHENAQEWFKEQKGPNEVCQKESKIASLRALKDEIEKVSKPKWSLFFATLS